MPPWPPTPSTLRISRSILACDLAALYGAPFDTGDAGEVAALLAVALTPAKSSTDKARSSMAGLLAPPDQELLARVGRNLLENSSITAIPFAGVPISAVRSHRATRQLGERAHEYVRRRRAIHDILQDVLADPAVDLTLLLEGAWFVSSCDNVVTHDELLLVSALARAIPDDRRPALDRLRFAGEGAWVMRLEFLDDARRASTLSALETIVALRGPVRDAERAFLVRVGEALGQPFDLARIEEVRAHLNLGPRPRAL